MAGRSSRLQSPPEAETFPRQALTQSLERGLQLHVPILSNNFVLGRERSTVQC